MLCPGSRVCAPHTPCCSTSPHVYPSELAFCSAEVCVPLAVRGRSAADSYTKGQHGSRCQFLSSLGMAIVLGLLDTWTDFMQNILDL